MKPKLVVILGPTASGKSSLAIKLAKKFNGEIISADSRQVYKGMDLGTGKVPISHGLRSKTSAKSSIPAKAGIYSGGVRHHLLDVASPKKQFTVSDFKHYTKKAIAKIVSKGKIPFLVGGTAFYIYALIDDVQIPEVKPNIKLRKNLEKKTTQELQIILKNLDPKRYKNIDKNNRVRLIRAIEINIATGKPVPVLRHPELVSGSTLILGTKKNKTELEKLIDKRVDQRFKAGMVAETKKLLDQGVSGKRLKSIGLTYGIIADCLANRISKGQMVSQVKTAEKQLARRQMTWFKRDKRIRWITNEKQAELLLRKYLRT